MNHEESLTWIRFYHPFKKVRRQCFYCGKSSILFLSCTAKHKTHTALGTLNTVRYDIVIVFYSPSCLGQETAKGPFGFRVKLPPAHLYHTRRRLHTVPLTAERQAGKL